MSWSCLLKFKIPSIISTQKSLWIFHWKSLKCAFTEIFSSEAGKQESSDPIWSSRSTSKGDLIRVTSTVFGRIWEHKDDSFASSCFLPCQAWAGKLYLRTAVSHFWVFFLPQAEDKQCTAESKWGKTERVRWERP